MKYETLFNCFLEEIVRKSPQKTEVVNILSDMLCIGKEAVYRRLRGEVPFTFYEAMTISRQLGITLDNLEMKSPSVSKPFRLSLIEYINPAESDFSLLEETINVLKIIKDVPDSKGGEITNILPQPLYVAYENIFRFYLFKWRYQSNRLHKAVPYKDIVIVDKLRKTQEENVQLAKCLHTEYIFDYQIFHYLVNNIKYFYCVGLITEEEVLMIKQDLLNILNQIDCWARSGFFKETGKKIDLYITNVNIDTSYVYMETSDYQLMIIKAFLLSGVASTDKRTYEELKYWIQSTKRQSVLITGSGEKERIDFLKEQHDIVESLSQLNMLNEDYLPVDTQKLWQM